MAEVTRVRINVKSGEIEFEGNQSFVETQLANLPELLSALKISKSTKTEDELDASEEGDIMGEGASSGKELLSVPSTFGEWYGKYPGPLKQTDQVLIAGYFVQHSSMNKVFKTIEANKTLKEQGIKVANAADSLKSLLTSKYIFVLKKEGKIALFRVSDKGEERLLKLLRKHKEK